MKYVQHMLERTLLAGLAVAALVVVWHLEAPQAWQGLDARGQARADTWAAVLAVQMAAEAWLEGRNAKRGAVSGSEGRE